ncbi:MlaD family protein [Nocardia vaccinii]|uniref:MlaD family protein n=1 Tax=Nocardia vaccinii TaxID=1822 RepID=UPI00082FD9BB|nr:MlaD family protein [Nocardia vaccinii]
MPAYALPGTEVGPRRARILGIGAVVLVLLILIAWRVVPNSPPADEIHVALITDRVGEGIDHGTDVRLDGVRVGSVSSVAIAGQGRQRIELSLLRSQLFGLTDALTVDYSPGNLFGITALQLNSAHGGTTLSNGSTVDLTGRDADRISDATLAALLESTGTLTNDVLTPRLAQLLSTMSRDISAFTPLMQAIGSTTRSFTETQRLPPSFLLTQFGSTLHGIPPMLSGAMELLRSDLTNPQLRTTEELTRFTRMFGNVQTQLLPVVTQTFGVAHNYFGGFIPLASLILNQLSGTVSTPALSGEQLSQLISRLDGAFHHSPSGPVLNTRVELDTVPGLAAPLAAALAHHPTAGGR